MLRIILAATLALAMVSKPAPSSAQCLGDFNGDSVRAVRGAP